MKWKCVSGRTAPVGSGLRAALVVLIILAAGLGSRARGGGLAEPGKPPAAPQAGYVGSEACKACHADVIQQWDSTAHGKRLTDPALAETSRGCEACHGPGSEHVGTMGKNEIGMSFSGAGAAQVEEACGRCHLSGAPSTPAASSQPINQKYWRRTLHARQQVSCLGCHKVHGGADKGLQQAPADLCLKCHASVVNKQGEYTHQPVAKGQCLLCHDPHGAQARHNVVANVSSACLTCHDAKQPSFTTAHSGYAVEKGDCLSCHSPHSFDKGRALLAKFEHKPFAARTCTMCHEPAKPEVAPALIKPEKELCQGCHPAVTIMPGTNAEGKKLVQHPPVQQGLCTTCHDPHAADHAQQMRDRTDYVCTSCHGGVEEASLAPYHHKPMESGDCLLCHRGHDSAERHLLARESVALCSGCHATQGSLTHPVGVQKGKTVLDPNTKQVLTCARCHAVHGSRLAALLPQDEDTLCRQCHGK